MYDDSAMIMTLTTLTSTHPGSGTELSFVDMPIQREGHTGYPKIEASTLKGCMRYAASRGLSPEEIKKAPDLNCLFGLPDKGDFASAVSITDARLLFFPVKSVKGILAWITCPFVINRFLKDYHVAIGTSFAEAPAGVNNGHVKTSGSNELKQQIGKQAKIMLEEYTFTVDEQKDDETFTKFIKDIYQILPTDAFIKDLLPTHSVLLSNDDFTSFVKHSTEISTRIRISTDTGTVDGNGLFTEEFLPPDCVFYSLLFFTKSHDALVYNTNNESKEKNDVKKLFLKKLPNDSIIQVGADSSLGKGLVQLNFKGGEENARCRS